MATLKMKATLTIAVEWQTVEVQIVGICLQIMETLEVKAVLTATVLTKMETKVGQVLDF